MKKQDKNKNSASADNIDADSLVVSIFLCK